MAGNSLELTKIFPGTQIKAVAALPVSPTGAEQYLVQDQRTGSYYIVSGVFALFTGWEVLVFPGDSDGEVTDWGEVAGHRGITFTEAILELEEVLSRPRTVEANGDLIN